MGEVYRARDVKLGRDVALKILPQEVAGDPDRLARFRREARAVAALNHPHIVTIYSIEEQDDVPFMTMELIEGCTLDRGIPGAGSRWRGSSTFRLRWPTRCRRRIGNTSFTAI